MQEIEDFIETLKKNQFVYGHEVLEDKWKEWKNNPDKKEESYILKGLINGSTALALKIKNKDDAAKRVWETYLKYAPLIETIASPYTAKYQKAQKILLEKYDYFFIQKSK